MTIRIINNTTTAIPLATPIAMMVVDEIVLGVLEVVVVNDSVESGSVVNVVSVVVGAISVDVLCSKNEA